MSNYYTEFIKPKIIEMIEEGGYTLKDIAISCNVSTYFVKEVRDMYDWFYVNK